MPRGRDYTVADPDPSGPYLATYMKTDYAQRDHAQVFITDRTARTTSYEAVNDGTSSLWALHAAILDETAQLSLFAQARTYYDGPAFTGRLLGKIGSYGAAVRSETLAFDDAIIDAAYASGNAQTVPPERPAYLQAAGGAAAWTAEYPAEFRVTCPPLAGFTWNPGGADPDDHPGYFSEASRLRLDFHTASGAEGPPGTGVGLPQVTRDPLGHDSTIVTYDSFKLKPLQVRGPTGLLTAADYDYRIVQVREVTTANGNRSQCTFTPLGMVASVAVMGKVGQGVGDTAATPSLRYVYDLSAFDKAAKRAPISVRTIRRVYHVTDTTIAAVGRNETRRMVEYFDGFGRKIQTRTEAADLIFGDPVTGDSGLPLDPGANADAVGHQRNPADPPNVSVTGWVIYDNKNHMVRSYEPFYSTGLTYAIPAGTQAGQHVDTYYDPPGRAVRTVNADGSETWTVYGVPGTIAAPDLSNPALLEPTAWETYTYDPNDNAGRTDPAGSIPYQSHWNTPSSRTTDALGRVITSVSRNGSDPATDWYVTQTSYDIRGNALTVTDTLGRLTYRRSYDYANGCLRVDSLDAGNRRTIPDAAGSPLESRAANGSLTLIAYDQAHRQIRSWARDSAGSAGAVTLRELQIYGESPAAGFAAGAAAAANLLGQVYQQYDEAGRVTVNEADFKDNPLEKVREVITASAIAAGSLSTVNWEPPAGSSLAALANTLLDVQHPYQTTVAYNALSQVVSTQLPVAVDGVRRVISRGYDRAGAITTLTMDGTSFVSLISYNARGQPTLTGYGNGLMTRCAYDPVILRLARVRSERYSLSGLDYQPAGSPLEDRLYAYDLIGNILQIQDRAPGSGVLANPAAFSVPDPVLAGLLAAGNALVRQFGYDPSYRLVSATGRECADIPAPRPVTDDPRCGYNSASFGTVNQGNAPSMTALYTESYSYDPIGDLVTLRHQTAAGTWTRDFGFGGLQAQAWQAVCAAHLNTGTDWTSPPPTQLTNLSNDPAAGTPIYGYDANGNLTGITTSRHLGWTHDDRLGCYRVQSGGAVSSLAATYLYDSAGIRIKKVVARGSIVESTVYIDGTYEAFQQVRPSGTIAQNTVHVAVGSGRVATIRVGTPLPDDATPATKYVLGDQLGTAAIVIDGTGHWVNREEFSPYGETLLGSYAHKRYRFAGRERDEESGLDYSQARYYAPWLARWISADPLTVRSLGADLNPYRYVSGQPISVADQSGLDDGHQSQGQASTDTSPSASSGGTGVYHAETGQWCDAEIHVYGTRPARTSASGSAPAGGTGSAGSAAPEAFPEVTDLLNIVGVNPNVVRDVGAFTTGFAVGQIPFIGGASYNAALAAGVKPLPPDMQRAYGAGVLIAGVTQIIAGLGLGSASGTGAAAGGIGAVPSGGASLTAVAAGVAGLTLAETLVVTGIENVLAGLVDLATAPAGGGAGGGGGGGGGGGRRTKPEMHPNPAHDPGSPLFNPRKTPEPGDTAAVYEQAIEGERGMWYGKSKTGDVYRYSPDNVGGVHFSGSTGGPDGIREESIPIRVRRQLAKGG